MDGGLFKKGFEAEHIEGLELHKAPYNDLPCRIGCSARSGTDSTNGRGHGTFKSVYIIRGGLCKGKNNKMKGCIF
jgi:hypothetical protein